MRSTVALEAKEKGKETDNLIALRFAVQSIHLLDPSQISTEDFSSPLISEKYMDKHIKSLEQSKKGKIQIFTAIIYHSQGQHENEATFSNLLRVLHF